MPDVATPETRFFGLENRVSYEIKKPEARFFGKTGLLINLRSDRNEDKILVLHHGRNRLRGILANLGDGIGEPHCQPSRPTVAKLR